MGRAAGLREPTGDIHTEGRAEERLVGCDKGEEAA